MKIDAEVDAEFVVVDLVASDFGEKNFRSGDRLADVALGVVGDVNEEAAERGWQRLLADRSGLLEIRICQCAHALRSVLQR